MQSRLADAMQVCVPVCVHMAAVAPAMPCSVPSFDDVVVHPEQSEGPVCVPAVDVRQAAPPPIHEHPMTLIEQHLENGRQAFGIGDLNGTLRHLGEALAVDPLPRRTQRWLEQRLKWLRALVRRRR